MLPEMVQAEGISFQRIQSGGAVYGQCRPYHAPAQKQQYQVAHYHRRQGLAFAKVALVVMRSEMTKLARQLPEYETVRAMYGVGETTAVQLMAEIGDVRRFPCRSSIVRFADVDPAVDESGKYISASNPTTKRGSPHLRKTLFQIMSTIIQHAPADNPVFQFFDRKRREGNHYVYMTAAANRFLRIYYGTVMAYLGSTP